MSQVDKLLDSMRFNVAVDDLSKAWRKRGVTQEEKRMRLEALLEAIGVNVDDEPQTAESAIADELARRKKNRVPEAEDNDAPITAAELARMQAETVPVSEEDIKRTIELAISEVIIPNWAKTPNNAEASKEFLVNGVRHGKPLSLNIDYWQDALQAHKLPRAVSFRPVNVSEKAGSANDQKWIVIIG